MSRFMKILRWKQNDYITKENKSLYFNRVLIGFLAFISGASVMIVELTANRILAPWFGNSLYTWTGLIGVILLSLSIGYYFGGWFADNKATFYRFFHLITASAIFIFLIPFSQHLLHKSMSTTNIISGPIIASVILFTLPGILLGSVSPYAIRLVSLLHSDRKIGISAGNIAMFSTLGSVLGTFASGFLLIPNLKISSILFLTSIILLGLALIGYAIFGKRYFNKYTVTSVILLFFSVLIFVYYEIASEHLVSPLIFDRTTYYHRIRVTETQEISGKIKRSLYLDTTAEGSQYLNSKEIPFVYQRYWKLSNIINKKLENIAFLGAGTFTMPEAMSDYDKNSKIDVVEIDPAVVEVGYEFFNLKQYKNIYPINEDARSFLTKTTKKYDLIFGDAFNGIRYVPAHLLTLEFFQLIKNRLNKDGTFMINIISSIKGDNSILFQSVMKTLSEVFNYSYVFAIDYFNPYSAQNIIIVSSDNDLKIREIQKTLQDDSLIDILNSYVPTNQITTKSGVTLTDNFNPIEYIVAKNL